MYANNEIGTIQPIKEIMKEIKYYRKGQKSFLPLFHIDAVQAANYLDLNVEKLGVDLLSLSGSKIERAGRVGVLYKKKSITLANIFGGGDQEMGLRPGTENLPEILKFSKALKSTQKIKEKETKRLTQLRDYFFEKLSKMSSNIKFNGDLKDRLPNNVNITIPNIPSDLLVIELSARGIMASSKSACKSSRAEGSYVIKAIRQIQGSTLYDMNSEIGGIRFSLGRQTTKADIDYTVKSLFEILTKLKKWYTPTPIFTA
jgi:cysteine desulfurase